MRKYTGTQAAADSIDRDLYRLMVYAERMVEDSSTPRGEKTKWQEAVRKISAARAPVRSMMHPQDRDETVG